MVIFQNGGRRHVVFLKWQHFSSQNGQGVNCVTMPKFLAIGQTVADI